MGRNKAVLDIQNFDKVAAVKMGIMPGHGEGFVAGNLLDFQGIHVGHEEGGVEKMPPVVQGQPAFIPFLPVYADFFKGRAGFLVHSVT